MKRLIIFCLITALISCKKTTQDDLCEGVICDNGGVCQNGSCQCPPMWTGPACQEEKPPLKMRVNDGIKLTSFNLTDASGGSWDVFDGPDIYLIIFKGSTKIHETTFVEDLITAYHFPASFEFDDPNATYTVGVYDYDDGLSADDYLGGIQFTPYLNGYKFPKKINLNCAGCKVSFEFDVLYLH